MARVSRGSRCLPERVLWKRSEALVFPRQGLKWPNDVLVEGKKLAGVLCEVHQNGGIIVGVGLNRRFLGEPPSENAVALSEFMDAGDAVIDGILAGFINLLRTSQTWDVLTCTLLLATGFSPSIARLMLSRSPVRHGAVWRGA